MAAITPRDRLEDLARTVRRAIRYWWMAVVVLAVGGAATGFLAMKLKPRFQSSTVLLYRELIPAAALSGGQAAGRDTRDLGQRVHDILFARPLLQKVIEEFGLYPDVVKTSGYVEAVDQLRRNIVFHAQGSGTFEIMFTDENPKVAQKVTTRLAEELIGADAQLHIQQANVTTKFLQGESDRAETEVEEKEKELAEFLTKHPEFVTESTPAQQGQAGAGVRAAAHARAREGTADDRVVELEHYRARLKARLEAPTTPLPQTPRTPRAPTPEMIAAQQKIDQAKTERDTAKRDYDRLSGTFTDKHPDVVAAKKRLGDAERRLKESEDAMPRAVDEPAIVPASDPKERAEVEKQIQQVDQEIAAYKRQAAGGSAPVDKMNDFVVDVETHWQQLNRELVQARDRHASLEARLFSAEISAQSELEAQGARMQVIDPAFVPVKAIGKSKKVILLAGLLACFAIGWLFAFGLALVDDRIYTRHDVDKLDLATVLISVPRLAGQKRGRRG